MSMPSIENWESHHYSSLLGYLFYTGLCYAVTKTFIYLEVSLGFLGERGGISCRQQGIKTGTIIDFQLTANEGEIRRILQSLMGE